MSTLKQYRLTVETTYRHYVFVKAESEPQAVQRAAMGNGEASDDFDAKSLVTDVLEIDD